MVAFFALIAWRFVFKGLRPRPLAREITAPRQQHTNALEQGLHILDPARVAVIPDYRFENGSDGVPITPKDRAKSYLHRIVALTGREKIPGLARHPARIVVLKTPREREPKPG